MALRAVLRERREIAALAALPPDERLARLAGDVELGPRLDRLRQSGLTDRVIMAALFGAAP